MNQVGNVQVEVIKREIGPWTFRRSLEPLATEIDKGKNLRARWEHKGYYFAVWESELLHGVSATVRLCHRDMVYKEKEEDFSFFRWREGAPLVTIDITPYDSTWEQRTTPVRVTHDMLTAIRPATFHVPPVILHTERLAWQCTIIGQIQGRTLDAFIDDIFGRDPLPGPAEQQKEVSLGHRIPLGLNASISPEQYIEAVSLYHQVAAQVVDTVVEMSRHTSDRVGGVDGRPSPDIHFTNVISLGVLLPREEVAQNCKDAGMDPRHTVLGPGSVSPRNIVLNEDGKFVGFYRLNWAGFAPREWVQLGLIRPNDKIAPGAHPVRTMHCDLATGPSTDPRREKVLFWWRDILSRGLASEGFPKLNALRLHWLKFKDDGKLGHGIDGSE